MRIFRKSLSGLTALLICFLLIGCNNDLNNLEKNNGGLTIRGADISFLPEIEQYGATYYDREGKTKDALLIFKENGCNTIRLRLWHAPQDDHSGLQEVSGFSKRIRNNGMNVWLDIHYSDSWADPGKQYKPAAWQGLTFDELEDSVYRYTKRVVSILQPDYVQIGNEINNGFLWDEGRFSNREQFTSLLKAGIKAARDYDPALPIMLHYAGHKGAEAFFRSVTSHTINFDIIALSYYPRWHGKSIDSLAMNINKLTATFNKPVVLAEVAYPFTLGWDDYTNNIIGEEDQLIDAYPPTINGQHDYLLELRDIVIQAETGMGICYWAPEWIAYKGQESKSGSPWENQALFDFDHKALPAMKIFLP